MGQCRCKMLTFILKFILSLAFTEEMLATFSAVSVLYNFHAVFKINLNGLFCIHYIMLSIGAGNNLFHSVRISGEGNFRMNNFLLKGLCNNYQEGGLKN